MSRNLTTKLVLAIALMTLLALGTLHFVFGVSSLVTLTIVLSFMIVLITAGGCALHLRELEILEEEETLGKMQERVDSHMSFINEILGPGKRRLKECEKALIGRPGHSATNNLLAAKTIIDALESRLDQLLTLLESGRPENILKASDITDSALKTQISTISKQQIAGALDHGSPVWQVKSETPVDLESHLWRETLDLLFTQIERMIDEKASHPV